MRISIIGLGPAGLAMSAAASVCTSPMPIELAAFDPHGPHLPGTLATWVDELPSHLRHLATMPAQPLVMGDGWNYRIPRSYSVLSSDGLRSLAPHSPRPAAVSTDMSATSAPAGAPPTSGDITAHPGGGSKNPADPGTCTDSGTATSPTPTATERSLWRWFRQSTSVREQTIAGADVIIDTVPRLEPAGLYQLALGYIVPAGALPSEHRRTVLMDWRTLPLGESDSTLPNPPATFSYRIPLGPSEWLIEETVLCIRTPNPHDPALWRHLRTVAHARCLHLGLPDPTTSRWREEQVIIPLTFRHSWFARQRAFAADHPLQLTPRPRHPIVIRWGTTAGTLNPVTGYSVGFALVHAASVLSAAIDGRYPASDRPVPPDSSRVQPTPATTAPRTDGGCCTPPRSTATRTNDGCCTPPRSTATRTHDGCCASPRSTVTRFLLERMAQCAAKLSAEDTRALFKAFFALTPRRQEALLTGTSAWGCMETMAATVVKLCAHKRVATAVRVMRGVF